MGQYEMLLVMEGNVRSEADIRPQCSLTFPTPSHASACLRTMEVCFKDTFHDETLEDKISRYWPQAAISMLRPVDLDVLSAVLSRELCPSEMMNDSPAYLDNKDLSVCIEDTVTLCERSVLAKVLDGQKLPRLWDTPHQHSCSTA